MKNLNILQRKTAEVPATLFHIRNLDVIHVFLARCYSFIFKPMFKNDHFLQYGFQFSEPEEKLSTFQELFPQSTMVKRENNKRKTFLDFHEVWLVFSNLKSDG